MNPRDYADCDAIALAARIANGQVSPLEVLDMASGLIERLDGRMNAFVAEERELAEAIALAGPRGPLAGVPIAMKDCVGLVAGARRSFGSRISEGMLIDHDDEVVVRYKAAGLVPFGTTNVPELSSSLTTESKLHGPCRNPWNLAHSVGGSTGGGAAAVASGIVPVAYGSDSAGSIRIPASCCGVFGFRPGRGRVPTGPQEGEIWFGLLSHHVITRSVRDSALLLDLTEGSDAGAPYAAPAKARPYAEELAGDCETLTIAVNDGSRQGLRVDPECLAALERTCALLHRLGHRVVPAAPDYSIEEQSAHLETLIAVSIAGEVPALGRTCGRPADRTTLEACQFSLLERGRRAGALQLHSALAFRSTLGRLLGRFLDDYDLLLTPALALPPPEIGWLDADSSDVDAYLERMWRYSPFTPLANFAGVPSMSVPLEWSSDGLPIGLLFTGRHGGEAALFRLAAQLERRTGWLQRHPPHGAWNL